jgi:hypothetical protein
MEKRMTSHATNEPPHTEPQTEYERMLDRLELDCSQYQCWNPIAVFVLVEHGHGCGRGADNEKGVCAEHVSGRTVSRWLET